MTTLSTRTDYAMLIGGELRPASDRAVIEATNPATGQIIGSFPAGTRTDVDLAVTAAQRAAPGWRRAEATQRAVLVGQLASAITEHAEEFARLDTADNGSLLREMRRDVGATVSWLRYFAGLALQARGTTLPGSPGTLTYTTRSPYGVVGRIVPFNHPFMFAAGKIAAPLIAGNTVVLKPSEHTSLSTLRLAELAAEILPPGVLNVVTGWGSDAGDALVAHPGVRRLAFTGSVATGLAIQRRAAEAAVKTVTLELGGKNPLVVFPDADLDVVVDAAVRGMNFTWQGQSCGSLSRVLIHTDVYDAFVERLAERISALRPGLPEDPTADTGAIVNTQQLRKVLRYVQIGRDEGARLCVGGERVTDNALAAGLFVRPTLFADVDPGSRLAQEEIFGPVLAALRFRDEEEAVSMANGTRFGLTASVFTSDLATAHRFAEAVDAGYVWINEVSRHIPGAPYGGVKDSGLGREEELDELLSYTQIKNVHINFGEQQA
ncbi:aldehyde dehydrogenase family protein [Streptomyces acidicola]|uniref:Aldehyde dehydrogenase family protein n=1 Tax=Streptomyces acidicola TaxID=2596892 RepID=A0A5N8WKQ9_9ACTN|nr:aldehyde dehydrogenase family protein [Streptomyces acidicola]MPY47426.1 aldehyde dehydrogenase family protein [Streptomyces acidicola]